MSIAEKITEIVNTNTLTRLSELSLVSDITPNMVKEIKDEQWSLLVNAADQLLNKYQSNDRSVV